MRICGLVHTSRLGLTGYRSSITNHLPSRTILWSLRAVSTRAMVPCLVKEREILMLQSCLQAASRRLIRQPAGDVKRHYRCIGYADVQLHRTFCVPQVGAMRFELVFDDCGVPVYAYVPWFDITGITGNLNSCLQTHSLAHTNTIWHVYWNDAQ